MKVKIKNIKEFNKQYNIAKRLLNLGSAVDPILYIKATNNLVLRGINGLVTFELVWDEVDVIETGYCGVYTPVFDVLKNAKEPILALEDKTIKIEDVFEAEFGIVTENFPTEIIEKPETIYEFPNIKSLNKLQCDDYPNISIRDGKFLSTDKLRINVYDWGETINTSINPAVTILSPTHFGIGEKTWFSNGYIFANTATMEPYPQAIYDSALNTKIISWFKVEKEVFKNVLDSVNMVGTKQIEGVYAVIHLFEKQLVIKSDSKASGKITQRMFVDSMGSINQQFAVKHMLDILTEISSPIVTVELVILKSPTRGNMEMLQIRENGYTYIIIGMVQ